MYDAHPSDFYIYELKVERNNRYLNRYINVCMKIKLKLRGFVRGWVRYFCFSVLQLFIYALSTGKRSLNKLRLLISSFSFCVNVININLTNTIITADNDGSGDGSTTPFLPNQWLHHPSYWPTAYSQSLQPFSFNIAKRDFRYGLQTSHWQANVLMNVCRYY